MRKGNKIRGITASVKSIAIFTILKIIILQKEIRFVMFVNTLNELKSMLSFKIGVEADERLQFT